MPQINVRDLEIAYEERGPADGEPMLLIMGIAGQLIDWPEPVLDALTRRGFRLILIDNRDAGLSTELTGLGVPDLAAIADGTVAAPYTAVDMAQDAVGVLDALGLDSVHILAVSMGATVAQAIALDHPERVRSLALVMSAPLEPLRFEPFRSAMAAARPVFREREVAISTDTAGFLSCGSPREQIVDEAAARRYAERRYDRSYRPEAGMRHVAVVLGAPYRLAELASIRIPTVVLHGDDDPVVPLAEGRKLSEAIPGSRFLVAERRGHQPLWLAEERYADAIAQNAGVGGD